MRQLMAVMAVVILSGCATKLDPRGPYGGDVVLYKADKTITESIDILDTFVKWEHNNRAGLAEYPEITKQADMIRENAQQWLTSTIAMRDSYAKSDVDVNKTMLLKSLDVLQSAITEASKYMKKEIR